MKQIRLVDIIFTVLKSFPEIQWDEIFPPLMERAFQEGDKNFAERVFVYCMDECVRFNDMTLLSWCTDEFSEDLIDMLKQKHLLDLGKSMAACWEKKSKKFAKSPSRLKFVDSPKVRDFDESSNYLCACCWNYPISCEEIQEFPVDKNPDYIARAFQKAWSMAPSPEKMFLVRRLLSEIDSRLHDDGLFYSYWYESEMRGIRYDAFIDIDDVIETEYWSKVLKIHQISHARHDNIVDDIVRYYIKNKKYSFARYWANKISRREEGLASVIYGLLSFSDGGEREKIFLTDYANSFKNQRPYIKKGKLSTKEVEEKFDSGEDLADFFTEEVDPVTYEPKKKK